MLAEGKAARTWRSFVSDHAAMSGLRAAHPEMTRLALGIALESVADAGHHGGQQTWVATLDGALGLLREAGVTAEMLRRTDRPRSFFFASLLEVTGDRLAKAGAFDRREAGFLAVRSIERASPQDLPSAVVIEGLLDWSASASAWVEALARRVPVTVRMPRAGGALSAATRAPDVLLSWLEERWQRLSQGPDLELTETVFPDDISLVECPSDAAEVIEIVSAVRDALGRRVPPAEIAIALPTLEESFLEPLRAALDEAGIAFAEPRGRPPLATPVVRAALAWLDLAAGPLARDALVDLLRTSAIDPAPFIEGPNPRTRRERALLLGRRLSRLPVGVDHDGSLLADLLALETAERPDEAWMQASLTNLLLARQTLAREAPRSDLAATLLATWRSMGLGGVRLNRVAALVAADKEEHRDRTRHLLYAQIREQAAGHEALVAAMDRIVEAATALDQGQTRTTIQRLRQELEESLSGAPPAGTSRPGAVRIVRVGDIAGSATSHMILARANEGAAEAMPAAAAVLGDDLVAALPRETRSVLGSLVLAARRTERLSALASAQKVTITRATTDESGRSVAPSALFAELASTRPVRKGVQGALDRRACPISPRAAELRRLAHGESSDDADLGRRVAIEQSRLAFFLDPRLPATAVTGAIATADDAPVASHLAIAVGGSPERPIAATAIERAAMCRFAAFALGVLGASVSDDAGEELEPWQRGSLVHRALQLAFEATRAKWDLLGRSALLDLGMQAARKALLRDRISPLYRAEVERALRDVAAVLEWSIDDASGYRFLHGERSFGEGDTGRGARGHWPPLRIGEGENTVFVKGRIDRVDLARSGSGARVIDYKTGTLPAWKDVGVTVFQPPLYGFALWLELGPLSMPEVRALYLDTSKRPPRVFPAEKSQTLSPELMSAAQRRAAEIVLRLRRGDVAPRPADALVCGRCSVRDVCRRPAAMPVDDLDAENDAIS